MAWNAFGVESVRAFDTPWSRFLAPQKKRYRYTKRVRIGVTRHGPVSIDLSKSQRIFVCASTGSGKTYLTRSIMDRVYRAGIIPVVLTDLKGEYYSSAEPNMDDNLLLLDGEEPSPLPVRVFYPRFFEEILPGMDLPFEYEPFEIDPRELTLDDIKAFVSRDPTEEQRKLLETVYRDGMSMEELENEIVAHQGFVKQTKMPVVAALQNLRKYRVLGSEYTDWVELINRGEVPVLCLAGFDRLGDENHFFITSYISFLVRLILDAAMRGEIKRKVLLVVEEAPRFIDPRTLSGKQILNACTVGRQYGISMLFDSQYISKSMRNFVINSRYIIVPNNIDLDTLTDIFKQFGLLDAAPQVFKSEVNSIRMTMRGDYPDGGRDWMIIDTYEQDYEIFRPLSCLSQHLHE